MAFACSQGTPALLMIAYVIARDVRMATTGDEAATWGKPSMAVLRGKMGSGQRASG